MCDIAINFVYNCLSVSPTRHYFYGDDNNRKFLEVVKIHSFVFFCANFIFSFCSHTVTSNDGIGTCWKVIEGVRERDFCGTEAENSSHSLSFCVCHLSESLLSAGTEASSGREREKKRRKNALHTLQRPFCLSMYIHPFFRME